MRTPKVVSSGRIDSSMRTVSFGPSTRKLPVPDAFPYQSHWKMEECHSAYWELVPTIDHIIPIAIGGEDNLSNYATTSMLHNSVKSNWTLEQLNWKLYPAGDINEYDGLTDLFVKLTENDLELFDDPYIKRWYKLSVGMK